MQIDGSTFIISGASSRLGAAVARMIVDEGGRVGLLDLDEAVGKTLEAELGRSSFFHKTDVTVAAQVQRAVDVCVSRFGGLDGAVCCASAPALEGVVDESSPRALEDFAHALAVNVIGAFNVAVLAARAIARRDLDEDGERGVIVMTAVSAVADAQSGRAARAASSAGVAGMTPSIAREFADSGIRVMTIAPGIFEAPAAEGVAPKIVEPAVRSAPAPQRLGRPTEFARLVRDICENRMLSGSVISLDGAARAPR